MLPERILIGFLRAIMLGTAVLVSMNFWICVKDGNWMNSIMRLAFIIILFYGDYELHQLAKKLKD